MVCCCREIPDGHKYNRYHGLDNIDVLKVICVLYLLRAGSVGEVRLPAENGIDPNMTLSVNKIFTRLHGKGMAGAMDN